MKIPTEEKVLKEIDNIIQETSFENFQAWQKNDSSYVTTLDIQLQARIVEVIRMYFPSHNILYEEGPQRYLHRPSEFTWVIDPIDGTNNLVRGKKEFGSSVGLMHHNKFIAALVTFPAWKESYIALEGTGIKKNGAFYTMPEPGETSREIILCSKSYESLKDRFRDSGYLVGFYNCATYSLLKLLKSEALVYHTRNTKIYDVGPMSFILSMIGIESYNRLAEKITFPASLERIPFFLAAVNRQLVTEFLNICERGKNKNDQ